VGAVDRCTRIGAHRKGRRSIAGVLGAVLFLSLAACGGDDDDGAVAADTTTTPTTKPNWLRDAIREKAEQGDPPTVTDSSTVAIFAPVALGQVVQQLTETYKTAHPEVTFQITTGTTKQLQDQIAGGAKPNIYIDSGRALKRVNGDLVTGKTVYFGSDKPVVVVKKGNPAGVRGLRSFGPDPATTSGICSGDSDCALYGQELLEKAKVSALPDLHEENQATLVDAVAVGNADVAVVMRSGSRNRFFKLSGVPLWYGPKMQVDYRVGWVQKTDTAAEFVRFATEFSAGKRILVARGLLPLTLKLKG
jgi:ABC-type molybdate transport system substrate-binding protein